MNVEERKMLFIDKKIGFVLVTIWVLLPFMFIVSSCYLPPFPSRFFISDSIFLSISPSFLSSSTISHQRKRRITWIGRQIRKQRLFCLSSIILPSVRIIPPQNLKSTLAFATSILFVLSLTYPFRHSGPPYSLLLSSISDYFPYYSLLVVHTTLFSSYPYSHSLSSPLSPLLLFHIFYIISIL